MDSFVSPARNAPSSPRDSGAGRGKQRIFNGKTEVVLKRPAGQEKPHSVAAFESGQKSELPNSTPITAATALRFYDHCLSDFEQSEIFDYPQVFFLGNGANKIKGSVSGYDDERGDYNLVLHDHVAFRYEVLSILGPKTPFQNALWGNCRKIFHLFLLKSLTVFPELNFAELDWKGSFGQVAKAFDYKTNTTVALKIIRNKKRFHHQALIEVKILDTLREHDPDDAYNIIRMIDYFYFRNHLCITFELLSMNLYEFIKSNNFQGLSLGLIRRFAIQLLTSLKYLYRERIVHCDLKPENILLKASTKSAIKIIDFGSSCFEDERIYTYIQSRFYRSPEVILGISYGRAIDSWSFGCILAELFTGYPLFPGENEFEQLEYIMEVFGVPSVELLNLSSRRKHFFDSNYQPRVVPNARKRRRPGTKDLGSALRCNNPLFVSFLEGFLKLDPRERFTPDDGLRHEWILEGMVQTPFLTPVAPPVAMARHANGSGRNRRRNQENDSNEASKDANVIALVPHPPAVGKASGNTAAKQASSLVIVGVNGGSTKSNALPPIDKKPKEDAHR